MEQGCCQTQGIGYVRWEDTHREGKSQPARTTLEPACLAES